MTNFGRNKRIELKKGMVRTVEFLSFIWGFKFELEKENEQVFITIVGQQPKIDLEEIEQTIKEETKVYENIAKTIYYLYSTNNLTIVGHEYPKYELWKHKHGYDKTIDHRYPISLFPDQTFNTSNWVPLSYEHNLNKGSSFKKELSEDLKKIGDRLEKKADKISDKIKNMEARLERIKNKRGERNE